MIKIEVDDILLPSFNKFYSQGIKVKRRSDMVWKWKTIIEYYIRKQTSKKQIAELQGAKMMKIDVTISFKGKRYDVDNCGMYGKLFNDCLKNFGIKDDNPEIINSISYTIDLKTKRNKVIYIINY